MIPTEADSGSLTGADPATQTRRRRSTPAERYGVWGITALAGAVAVVAPGEPTGLPVADALWRASLAVLVALAASRARRWSWLWLSGLAAAAAVGSPWLWLGVLALILAVAGAFRDRRNRLLGAAVGGAGALTLLHLPPDLGFFGFPSLLAAIAIVPTIWSAWDRSRRRDRQRIRTIALGGGLVAFAALLGLSLAALDARSQLQRGVDAARDGLDAVRQGDQERAAARFDDATSAFGAAADALSAPWALPGRTLPVIGHQVEALVAVAESGDMLSGTAAVAATTAPYQDLRAAAGQVDLGTVRAMQAPVEASAAALRDADARIDTVRSPWLLPPIADPLAALADDIDETLPDAELAAEGLRVAPGLLGGEGARSYVVLFTNPAESRFLGGFVGSYGILTAVDGKVSLTESGSVAELRNAEETPTLTLDPTTDPDYLTRYGRYAPTTFFQNLTASPDFPTDAAVTADLVPQATGIPVDGVIVADPFAIGALLSLTGPVTVEGIPVPLSADNAARYLLYEQYLAFEDADDERRDALAAAAEATFEALTSRELPGPRALGDALGPVMRQGRLLFTTFDAEENAFLDRLGTRGRFAPTPGADYLSVRTADALSNKIDTFLDRVIDHDVAYDPATGEIQATTTVRLTNRAPAGGLPRYVIGNDDGLPPGTSRLYLSLYTPLELVDAALDGGPMGVEPQREFGGNVFSQLVTIPPGATVELRFRLRGRQEPGDGYRVDLLAQPLANPDQITVSVASSNPQWGLEGSDGPLTQAGPFTEDQQVTATFAPR